ncbi:hypothetical protein CF15_01450 [Pyrodictium occultum]|uniref:Molybdate/tungstate import ATP-binding protein WtpC n=1 Tax=Pyrodictium occultum TaxID=2309 RepID=A0A0V8RTZ4_PYROC|nr:ATP-binding cassette domain-containing protein [Pyrodictium occultum]KSW11532.1 hypothetical protein CF15_01450 [Pyrodictium occultum]
MAPAPALRVEDLWVKRKSRLVLRGVSLELEEPSILVVLGPNGAGKTTLLETVAGLVKPSRGRIVVSGETVYSSAPPRVNTPPERRGVAYVPQDYGLFPHMTVYENIAFGLRARRCPGEDVDRRVRGVAGVLGIEHLLDRRPAELSGGERQRVALARALAVEPRLLLLDEPFSALDAPSRERLRSELRSLLRRLNVPAVIVTHSFSDAWALGDRIAVLDSGRVVAEASPGDLALRPLRHGVAEFLGYMVLEARVLRAEGGRASLEAPGLGLLEAAVDGLEPGSRVLVALRPDDLVVSARPVARTNTYRARVAEAVVTRHGVRLLLEVGGLVLRSEQARGPLLALLGRLPGPGDQVYVHIPPGLVDVRTL